MNCSEYNKFNKHGIHQAKKKHKAQNDLGCLDFLKDPKIVNRGIFEELSFILNLETERSSLHLFEPQNQTAQTTAFHFKCLNNHSYKHVTPDITSCVKQKEWRREG